MRSRASSVAVSSMPACPELLSARDCGIELLEGSRLEPLIPNDQAVGFPEEDLDPIPSAIEKQEEVTGERILAQEFVHHSQEAVEAFSHVGRPGAEENAHGGGELREHHLAPSPEPSSWPAAAMAA